MIHRDIYAEQKNHVDPIRITAGSTLVGIEFEFKDITLVSGSSATIYVESKQYGTVEKVSLTRSGNKLSFYPTETTFKPGANDIQIKLSMSGKKYNTFHVNALAEAEIEYVYTPSAPVDDIQAFAERAETAALAAEDWYNANAEMVDTKIGDASETLSSAISKNSSLICNPNLLVNWDFTHPVNQRGVTDVTGNYRRICDRWLTQYNSTHAYLDADGLTIVNNKNEENDKLSQILSRYINYSFLSNKKITLSAVVKTNVTGGVRVSLHNMNGWGTVQKTVTVTQNKETLLTCTGTMVEIAATDTVQFGIQGNPGVGVTIKAVKMELGDTQTLAYFNGTEYVLRSTPTYDETLRLCLPYLVNMKPSGGGTVFGVGACNGYDSRTGIWTVRFNVPIPTTMRARPALEIVEAKEIRVYGSFDGELTNKIVDASRIAVVHAAPGSITIGISFTEYTLSVGGSYAIYNTGGSTLLFNAEL